MAAERMLITGGAGFIGSNLADRLLGEGHRVVIFDNLSRPGVARNLDWLRARHPHGVLEVIEADLADAGAVRRAVVGARRVYHLGGQVAVTSSIADPYADFVSNTVGTLHVLEAVRRTGDDPVVIYASTNKVYGGLEDVAVTEHATRYAYAALPHGIAETQPLDFHSPYACSKGAGDQYARDYARIYGLRAVVVRQSCIYGPRQFGSTDQGWLAWLIGAALRAEPIAIYGNGKQVRDVLAVADLLDAYDAIVANIAVAAGQIYNVGGGPEHTISIWSEFGTLLEALLGRPVPVTYHPARAGDQKVFVSDVRKAGRELGWQPRVGVRDGIAALIDWIRSHGVAAAPTGADAAR